MKSKTIKPLPIKPSADANLFKKPFEPKMQKPSTSKSSAEPITKSNLSNDNSPPMKENFFNDNESNSFNNIDNIDQTQQFNFNFNDSNNDQDPLTNEENATGDEEPNFKFTDDFETPMINFDNNETENNDDQNEDGFCFNFADNMDDSFKFPM